jgi:hypothetical protein
MLTWIFGAVAAVLIGWLALESRFGQGTGH